MSKNHVQAILANSKQGSDGTVTITLYQVSALLGIPIKSLFKSKALCKRLLANGFEMHSLTDNSDIPDWVVICILEHFAYENKTPNEQATDLFRLFAVRGFGTIGIIESGLLKK